MSHGEAGHASEWRIAVKGEQRGPFTLDQVRAMIVDGRLPADALVWRPGMANWAALAGVPELVAPVSRGPAPAAATSPAPSAAAAATPIAADAASSASSPMADFLAFRTMLTPMLVKVLFWIGIAGCVISALGQLSFGFLAGTLYGVVMGVFMALVTLVVGPVVVRVYCELTILLFRIYDTLQEIKEQRK